MIDTSTPGYQSFDPTIIPMQLETIKLVRKADYSLGTHEVMLSGSVGSAKSILMAHIILRHCFENPGARVLIARRALPDLKDTLYKKILEHLLDIPDDYYKANDASARIEFRNGSEILARSWADKRYSKLRSLELSMAAIEELSENTGDDWQAYEEIKMRVGRLPHIKKPLIICATNPDDPTHPAYKHFIQPNTGGLKHPTRHVIYSLTEQNPFLPRSYIAQLKADMDPKMAQRMLYGLWVSISQEVIYYEYDRNTHFVPKSYTVDPKHPVLLSWDFNIGEGKPMSAVAMQYINDHFHIFAEVIIDGGRTIDTVHEMMDKGIINKAYKYEIHGDASGKARDTRSNVSDYDIIVNAMRSFGANFTKEVPLANPNVRTRHNKLNAYFKNELGQSRVTVWNCPTVDEGFRLVKLKKGSSYVEDDSIRSQHVTTAVGYCIMRKTIVRPKPSSQIL